MGAKIAVLGGMALLAGCGPLPQTAQEFRERIPGWSVGYLETLEVDRPYQDVSKMFQAKAPECLNLQVRYVEHTRTRSFNSLLTYKATVVVGDKRTELHLQRRYDGNFFTVYKEPEGGQYVVVADAMPLAANRTKVDIYRYRRDVGVVVKAITAWANGQNGCPDMTKI